jgi:hypothetical protein
VARAVHKCERPLARAERQTRRSRNSKRQLSREKSKKVVKAFEINQSINHHRNETNWDPNRHAICDPHTFVAHTIHVGRRGTRPFIIVSPATLADPGILLYFLLKRPTHAEALR